MSKKRINYKKKFYNWLLDHIVIKYFLEYFVAFLVSTASAILFAFTMKVFIMPSILSGQAGGRLATGGASGFAQDFALLAELIFGIENIDADLIYSTMYLIINIPLIIMSFFKIGKRFTVFTLISVFESSLLVEILGKSNPEWIDNLASLVNENGGMLARSIFGGVIMGLSSALPYKLDFSAGGVDILVYLISSKKETSTGKFTVSFNSIAIVVFCLLTATLNGWGDATATSFAPMLYCILYLFVSSLVIDAIHIRNKKCEIKVITEDSDLVEVLLTEIPHGATIVKGTGAFTGTEKTIISMVISSNEVNSILRIIKKEDPGCFVEVYELHRVLGSFYLKPIK